MALQKEIGSIIETHKNSSFVVARYDSGERILNLTFVSGSKKVRLTVHIPTEYPKEPVLCLDESGEYDSLLDKINEFAKANKSIVKVAEYIVKEFTTKLGASEKKKPAKQEDSEEEEDYEDEDEDNISDNDMEPSLADSTELAVESSRLRHDVEELMSVIGTSAVKYLPDLHMVRLFIDMSFLGENICNAIGIYYGSPINVTLVFAEDYLDSTWMPNSSPVKIEIDQKPYNEHFGLQFQITEISKKWLHSNWSKYKESKGPALSSVKTSSSKGTSTQNKYAKQEKDLLDMGFPAQNVRYALHLKNGNVDESLALLIDPSSSFVKEAKEFASKGAESKNEGKISLSSSTGTLKKDSEEISIVPGRNFLLDLFVNIVHRISNCSNFCPICDRKHEMEGIKPIVCSKKDCIWRYEELGLGASISAEVNRAPDVVDLLISCALCGLYSGRGDKIFLDSFPSDFIDIKNGQKDYARMQKCLEAFPPVAEMVGKDIRSFLESKDPLAFRLLRWLITSNRAHLVKLPEGKYIDEMATKHQYMLLTSTPEKEAQFTQLKKQHGSFFAFHGSPMENWHAILRVGLKNLSNKPGFMLHGAAHGAGIYLAPQSGTSASYMRSGRGWDKSQFGVNMSCIAVCEVIDHSSVKGRNHKEWCYVVDNEDYVMTRYFFIYGGSYSMPQNVAALTLKAPNLSDLGITPKKDNSKGGSSWWKKIGL